MLPSRRDLLRASLAGALAGSVIPGLPHRAARRGAADDLGGEDHDSDSSRRDPLTTHDPALYLLVDDRWIAEQTGLRRIANQAVPLAEPIVAPDDPACETDCAWGNVIRDSEGRLRLFYCTMMMGHRNEGPHEMARAGVWGRGEDFSFHPRSPRDVPDTHTMLGKLATSDDGLRWTKPELGLVEFRGSAANNILLTGQHAADQTDGALTNFDGYTILRDDDEPDPARRYKLLAHWESVHFWDNHEISGALARPAAAMEKYAAARGEYITYSPDGLRWEQPLVRIDFPSGGGDRMLVVRDHRHGRWMAYARAGGWGKPALSYSDDLVRWSEPEYIDFVTPDSIGAPAVECLIPFNYGNQDLAFPCGMDKPRGILFPLLLARQDGQPWHWVESQRPVIPFGEPGSYHATGAVPLHNEPIVVGDELYIYFNAFSRDPGHPCPAGSRSIGLARLRRDGFAGLAPAEAGGRGELVTQPLEVTGQHLCLNVQQRGGGGRVEAALLDADGNAIDGCGFSDCQPLKSDGVRLPVAWRGRENLRDLIGRRVKLALRLSGEVLVYAEAFA